MRNGIGSRAAAWAGVGPLSISHFPFRISHSSDKETPVSAPDPHEKLKAFQPRCRYFVGIDSDGCAFDTMEPKHKECFCPVTVWKWDLAAVS
jgi:hypothetical protein